MGSIVEITSPESINPSMRAEVKPWASMSAVAGARASSLNPKKLRGLYDEERLQVRRRSERKRAEGT